MTARTSEFWKPIQSFLTSKPFWRWWAFALFCRLIAAWTHAHWFHLDEWYQTIEPANLIAHGFGLHSQEIGLHLRNLTWPLILAGVLKASQILAPNAIDLRFFSVNALCGMLDLFILWGWIQLLNTSQLVRSLPSRYQNWSLALLLLPWFTIYHSVNPRAEHLSEIALWICLGCMARRFWFLAGFFSIAIFGFRYPSILLTAGIFLGVGIQYLKTKNQTLAFRFSFGAVLGLVLFGATDALIYGRPWESFWMYLQYNLFTGSGTQVFGRQGISPYLDFFIWNWGKYPIYIPIGLALTFGFILGTILGLIRLEIWAFCIPVYLIGHLLIGHKEGRFMVPIETLTRWIGFIGLAFFFRNLGLSVKIRSALQLFFLFFFSINSILLLHALRADLWRLRHSYLEIGDHLKSSSAPVCAILTPLQITSLYLPLQKEGIAGLSPPVGRLLQENRRPTYSNLKNASLLWIEHAPACNPTDSVMVNAYSSDDLWNQEGCKLKPTGLLKLFPNSLLDWAIHRQLAHGLWYECPSKILTSFASQQVVHYLSTGFGKISQLPRMGISPLELENLGRETSPAPRDSLVSTVKDFPPEQD